MLIQMREKGQGLLEYAAIAIAVALVAAIVVLVFSGQIQALYDSLKNAIAALVTAV